MHIKVKVTQENLLVIAIFKINKTSPYIFNAYDLILFLNNCWPIS